MHPENQSDNTRHWGQQQKHCAYVTRYELLHDTYDDTSMCDALALPQSASGKRKIG